jgi:hypothetical protein
MLRARMVSLALVAVGAFVSASRAADGPFSTFDLPDRWEAKFWADPGLAALLDLDVKAIAALVPEQAGFKYCRCPKCGVSDLDDPLSWSIAKPDRLTCRTCSATFPDEKYPAKTSDKVPEEVVEVSPRHFHRYPYHAVEAEKCLYPDERIYLAAKRDHEAREFLAKAAMYAAVRYHEQPAAAKDARLAKLANTLVLRFAQVYPRYATHHEQPGAPKSIGRADLRPPFRRNYGTAKWDVSGNLDVPMNLVIAYALVRGDPSLIEAGKVLGDPNPARSIERDLFFASAEFVRAQPEESSEASLFAYRGMLAVGRLLDDPALVREATARLDGFLARGFYHDGLWRQGDAATHRRVVNGLDGWIARLLPGSPMEAKAATNGGRPAIVLAREAAKASWIDPRAELPDVILASWPATPDAAAPRRPALLGGAGIARLGVGQGEDALDLELRGMGDYGGPPSGRLSLRLAVGGTPLIGDLDGEGPTAWGFEHASASKSGLVLVDGLNQRESIDKLRSSDPGADIQFFAADPDFQVARMADRFAYPNSAKLYRHTVVLSAGAKSRYAVSIVDVDGGLQHDQIFHGPTDRPTAAWRPSVGTGRGPASLLPAGLPFVPTARPEDGRWFVQGMGAFSDLAIARLDRPTQVSLDDPGEVGVRLHLLSEAETTAYLGRSVGGSTSPEGRTSVVLRRRSEDGSALSSTFVTLLEPIGRLAPLRRVGRVKAPPGVTVIAIETAEGTEFLAVNSNPGEVRDAPLPDGRVLRFDGLAARVVGKSLLVAGGTFAEVGDRRTSLDRVTGTIVAAGRSDRSDARGMFRVTGPLPHPEALAGRTLMIRHGDGTSRGWTIVAAENLDDGGARFHVREDAGLRIEPQSGTARYDRFPGGVYPGPHKFGVSRIGR